MEETGVPGEIMNCATRYFDINRIKHNIQFLFRSSETLDDLI
jgi:hypothetical protein